MKNNVSRAALVGATPTMRRRPGRNSHAAGQAEMSGNSVEHLRPDRPAERPCSPSAPMLDDATRTRRDRTELAAELPLENQMRIRAEEREQEQAQWLEAANAITAWKKRSLAASD